MALACGFPICCAVELPTSRLPRSGFDDGDRWSSGTCDQHWIDLCERECRFRHPLQALLVADKAFLNSKTMFVRVSLQITRACTGTSSGLRSPVKKATLPSTPPTRFAHMISGKPRRKRKQPPLIAIPHSSLNGIPFLARFRVQCCIVLYRDPPRK